MTTRLKKLHPSSHQLAATAIVLFFLSACSDGLGSSSGQATPDFQLLATNVSSNAVWELNRPIEISFNTEVDLNSVNANTVRIANTLGQTAAGVFTFLPLPGGGVDRTTIRFQPTCPTLPDLSDSGLIPGNVSYNLQIIGSPSGQSTVTDVDGRILEVGITVPFRTASGQGLGDLFVDSVAGPPSVRVRGGFGVPIDELAATYLEIGGDPDDRIYFTLDENLLGALPEGVEAPLNFYSVPESEVAVVLFLDQPVAPGANNVNSSSIGLEWRVTSNDNDWEPIVSEVTLDANCTETGAIVRIEPQGLLPQNAELRIVVRPGLSDITGELTPSLSERGGRFNSREAVAGGGQAADEILERFAIGGDLPGSIEDEVSIDGTPRAVWGDGRLEAGFDFDGTGGVNGNFDFVIPAGEQVTINTQFTQITGGPGGDATEMQEVIGGVIDVRNFTVGQGALLIFVGLDPVTILASGEVQIDGQVIVSGSNNPGVGTLNTTNQPEPGSAGNAGGGNGGDGSPQESQSSPSGVPGDGAFGEVAAGGGGGETGFGLGGPMINPNEDGRRGAGGGGGSLGRDIFYDHDANPSTPEVHCQTLIGMDGENGFGGTAFGLGALSMVDRPMGGAQGPFPFVDQNQDNDFLGGLITADGTFIEGEADGILAGAGGGGGGDAVNSESFPLIPFSNSGDEKGGGGGGGAGGISILAIGSITLGPSGRIIANGGHGGGSENSFNFDAPRVGGSGGGGSGGHIVLSSGSFVEVQGQAIDALDGYRDSETAFSHDFRVLNATGGQGGEGNGFTANVGTGGADADGPTFWNRDAIPIVRLDIPAAQRGGVPPFNDPTFNSFFPDIDDPLGPALSVGGDGSPGILQIHVADPSMNLRFTNADIGGTYGAAIGGSDVTRACAPPPFGWQGLDQQADSMLPFFGRFSASQSDWVHLGVPSIDLTGGLLPLDFLFEGTDQVTGVVDADGTVVATLPPILGPVFVGSGPGEALLLPGGLSFEFDAGALPEIYQSSPQLLTGFNILLEAGGGSTESARFEIQAATVDPGASILTVFVAETATTPLEFLTAAGLGSSASIEPTFFRLETAGQQGMLTATSSVMIEFDATTSNSLNEPDEGASFSASNGGDFATNISDLTNDPWSWVRFRVTFDIANDAGALPLNSPLPSLTLLRLPFLF